MVRITKISSRNNNIFSSKLLWFLQQQRRSNKILSTNINNSEQYPKHPTIYVESSPIFTPKFHEPFFLVNSIRDIKGNISILSSLQTWLEIRVNRDANLVLNASTIIIKNVIKYKKTNEWKHAISKFRWKLSRWKVVRDR